MRVVRGILDMSTQTLFSFFIVFTPDTGKNNQGKMNCVKSTGKRE
jgi:hypothetical protein